MHPILSSLVSVALAACRAVPAEPAPVVLLQDAKSWGVVSAGAGYQQFSTRGDFGDLLVVVRGDKVTALLDGEVLPAAQVQRDGDTVVVSDAAGQVLHEVHLASVTGVTSGSLFVAGDEGNVWRVASAERRKLIGVTTSQADGALKAQLGVQGDALVIETVTDDMPAHKAGLQPLDVVVAIEGQPGATNARLREVLAAKQPGETLQLSVRRRGEELDLALVVEEPRAADDWLGGTLAALGYAGPSKVPVDTLGNLFGQRAELDAQRAALDARLAELRVEAEALAQQQDDASLRQRAELAAREAALAAERAALESRLAAGQYDMALLGDGGNRSLVLPRWGQGNAAAADAGRLERLEERLARLEELLEQLAARRAGEPAPAPAEPSQP